MCDANEWEDACQGQVPSRRNPIPLRSGRRGAARSRNTRDAPGPQPGGGQQQTLELRPRVRDAASARPAVSNQQDATGAIGNNAAPTPIPTGDFPACHSPLEVYDLNGNAAEHMNLPLNPSQMSSRGSTTLGYTEMKGSWFIFDTYRAHEDWCRWRAPFWHGTRVLDQHSHANYHLGFRCCNSLGQTADDPPKIKQRRNAGGCGESQRRADESRAGRSQAADADPRSLANRSVSARRRSAMRVNGPSLVNRAASRGSASTSAIDRFTPLT